MKNILSSFIAITAAALLLGIVDADAQTTTSTGTGTATSTATSGVGTVTVNVGGEGGGGAPSSTTQATLVDNRAPAQPDSITVKNVPNIVAPALTTTLTETCMGSTSGGAAVAGFGITIGSTWKDDECVNRLNSRELRSLGEYGAAKEVLCANPVVREAFKTTGKPCGKGYADVVVVVVTQTPTDGSAVVVTPYVEPKQIERKRYPPKPSKGSIEVQTPSAG